MNIGRPCVDRLGDDQVDEFNNGSVALISVLKCGGRINLRELDRSVGELDEHGVNRFRFGLTVVPVDRFLDLFLIGKHELNVAVQDERQFLLGFVVGRVCRDDLECVPFQCQGKHEVFRAIASGMSSMTALGISTSLRSID